MSRSPPPTVLIVEPQPGQLAADVRNVAHRLAGSLGAVAPRVESHGPLVFRRFVDHSSESGATGAPDRDQAHPSTWVPQLLHRLRLCQGLGKVVSLGVSAW